MLLCLEGILLTRTRLAVSKLVNYVHEQPQLQDRVFADKLVGQGPRDGTMTDTQQENTLRRFRAGYQQCFSKTILWYRGSQSNTVEETLASSPNSMQAVEICCNKILQFLTEGAS